MEQTGITVLHLEATAANPKWGPVLLRNISWLEIIVALQCETI
jgi:hypothetical protein